MTDTTTADPVAYGEAPSLTPAAPPAPTMTEDKIRKLADSLIGAWQCQETEIDENRQLRKLDFSPERCKALKLIGESETFIGFRVIDENISREIPIFLKYIGGSSRQLIFKPLNQDSSLRVSVLEDEFTAYSRYENWQIPFYQAFDSAALNGRGIIEILADQTKHSGISREFIETQDFLFPLEARNNIQNAPMLARRYHWNAEEFKQNAKILQLDSYCVDQILANSNEQDAVTKTYCVYKLFYRLNDVVMCAWYSKDVNDKLLKQPYAHVNGKFDAGGKPIPMSYYPFFVLQYRMTEETKLTYTMGRAKLDKFNQEGQCRLGTSFVNGVARASHVYASMKGSASDSNNMEATAEIVPDKIVNKDITFVGVPYPDPIVINAIGMLAGRNSQATGQVDYTAKNRQDSRKTAKEIEAAQQQAAELSGITIFAVSQFMLQVGTYEWNIIQSNALLQPDSKFLTHIDGMERLQLLMTSYNLLPAGDIDYVERQQKINRMMDFWPMFAQTTAAVPYLQTLITLALPDEAPKLIQAMQAQGDPRASMGAAVIEILAQIPREQLLALFGDEQTQAQFNTILDQAINVFRQSTQDGGPAGAQQQPAVQANSPNNPAAARERNRQSAPVGARG